MTTIHLITIQRLIIEEKEKEPQLDAQALENLKKGKGKSKKGGKKGGAGSKKKGGSTSKKDMIAKMPVNF